MICQREYLTTTGAKICQRPMLHKGDCGPEETPRMPKFTLSIDHGSAAFFVMVQHRWDNGNVKAMHSTHVSNYDEALATARRFMVELEIIKE